MIFGAIVAGGIGMRMNISDMPKQFLPLGNKPIIIHTIEKFLMCHKLDKIFIGVHPNWLLYVEDLLKKYAIDANRIFLAPGGNDRNATILNIIEAIHSQFGESDDHIIVTHDAVRPFVTLKVIEDNIAAALKYGACDTVYNAIDTMVVSDDGEVISSIPDRRTMYHGQTPQSFRINLLTCLYNKLTDDEKKLLTDACKICVMSGVPVKLVTGDISNMKITTVNDYKIAQAMVGGTGLD